MTVYTPPGTGDESYGAESVGEGAVPYGTGRTSLHEWNPYDINHPIISIRYFGDVDHVARRGADTGGNSARRDFLIGAITTDPLVRALTPAIGELTPEPGYETMHTIFSVLDDEWVPKGHEEYFGMRGESKTVRRTITSAINGLPETNPQGFLDINSEFINRIQTSYDKSDKDGDSFKRTRLSDNIRQYNAEFGFDGDGDGLEFREFYALDYGTTGWASLSTKYRTIARLERNSWNVQYMTGDNDYGTSDSFFSMSAFLDGDEMRYGSTTGKYNAVNPAVEVPMYAHHSVLDENWGWYTSVSGNDYDFINDERDTKGNGGDLTNKFYCGGYPTSGYWSATHEVTTYGSGMSKTVHDAWTQSYSYGTSTYPEIVADIESRFKTLAYVRGFSQNLIDDRIFKIASALTATVERAADIKIQENQPINTRLLSAVGEDYNIEEGMVPDTSIEGTDAGGRSIEEALMRGIFGDTPGVY